MTKDPDVTQIPRHYTDQPEVSEPASFWRSRAGAYLIVAITIGGLMLGYEHRVHLLGSGLLLWLPLLICVGMHFFMHRGHGGPGPGEDQP